MLVLPLLAPALTRRSFAAALLAPLAGCATPDHGDARMNSSDVAQLIERAKAANDAFIGGDMRRWYALVSPIASDFTLMSPFGGEPSYGFDGSEARLDVMAAQFTGGRRASNSSKATRRPIWSCLPSSSASAGASAACPSRTGRCASLKFG